MNNEFDEIRPYEAGEMQQAFDELINDRQFSLVLKGFGPWLPKSVRNGLLKLAFIALCISTLRVNRVVCWLVPTT